MLRVFFFLLRKRFVLVAPCVYVFHVIHTINGYSVTVQNLKQLGLVMETRRVLRDVEAARRVH